MPVQMITKSTLVSEKEQKKLWVLCGVVIVTGMSLFFSDFVSQLLGVASISIQLLAGIVCAISIAWLFFAVRCPYCGLRLVIYAIQHKAAGEWLQWILSVKTCPSCGQPDKKEY